MSSFPEMLFYAMKAAEEFVAADAPDGAWWAILQDTAYWYMNEEDIKGDPFEAVHAYLKWKTRSSDEP